MRVTMCLALAVVLIGFATVRTDGQPLDPQLPTPPSKGQPQFPTPLKPADVVSTKAEHPKLTGTWIVQAAERESQKLPEERVQGVQVVITAETITMSGRDGKPSFVARYKLNMAKTPNEIDMTVIEGPTKGQVAQGIVELESNERIKLCYSPGIQGRPNEFVTKTGGSDEFLFILTRGGGAGAAGGQADANAQSQPGQVAGVILVGGIPFGGGAGSTTWKVVSGEHRGQPLPPDRVEGDRVTVTGRTLVLTDRDGKQRFVASFSIDGSQQPNQITMTVLDGPEKGKTASGIIASDGKDQLKLCYAVDVPERPREFRTRPNNPKEFLFVLKRESGAAAGAQGQQGQGQTDQGQQKNQGQQKQGQTKQSGKGPGGR